MYSQKSTLNWCCWWSYQYQWSCAVKVIWFELVTNGWCLQFHTYLSRGGDRSIFPRLVDNLLPLLYSGRHTTTGYTWCRPRPSEINVLSLLHVKENKMMKHQSNNRLSGNFSVFREQELKICRHERGTLITNLLIQYRQPGPVVRLFFETHSGCNRIE